MDLQTTEPTDTKPLDLSQIHLNGQDISTIPEDASFGIVLHTETIPISNVQQSRQSSLRPHAASIGISLELQGSRQFDVIDPQELHNMKLSASYRKISRPFIGFTLVGLAPLFTIIVLAGFERQSLIESCQKFSNALIVLILASVCLIIMEIFGVLAVYNKSKGMIKSYIVGLFLMTIIVFLCPAILAFPGDSTQNCQDTLSNALKLAGAVIFLFFVNITSICIGMRLLRLLKGAK